MNPVHVLIAAALWLAITILATRPRSYCDEVDTERERLHQALAAHVARYGARRAPTSPRCDVSADVARGEPSPRLGCRGDSPTAASSVSSTRGSSRVDGTGLVRKHDRLGTVR